MGTENCQTNGKIFKKPKFHHTEVKYYETVKCNKKSGRLSFCVVFLLLLTTPQGTTNVPE